MEVMAVEGSILNAISIAKKYNSILVNDFNEIVENIPSALKIAHLQQPKK